MLVLSRKVDESILIGENIKIKIVGIEGNKVRIGIIADKDISIVREEILEAVKKENLSAKIGETTLNWTLLTPQPEDK